jgi:hypothetical protein
LLMPAPYAAMLFVRRAVAAISRARAAMPAIPRRDGALTRYARVAYDAAMPAPA